MTMSSPLRPLAGNWLAATFLLLAAGVGALWYSAIAAYESAVLRERGRELQAIAELKIGYIEYWLNERRGDAILLSKRQIVAIALAGSGADKAARELAARALPDQIEAYRKAYVYESIVLLDRDGNPVFGTGAAGGQLLAVAAKTARTAVAEGAVRMSHEAFELVSRNAIAKGDVLRVAEVAGVMGGKRTNLDAFR